MKQDGKYIRHKVFSTARSIDRFLFNSHIKEYVVAYDELSRRIDNRIKVPLHDYFHYPSI